jgi:4-hydroxy-3-polyprenylbenzoate decarboxylase
MSGINPQRIVVGITGASGAIYGIQLLKVLRQHGIETHLVISESAKRTIELETDYAVREVEALAGVVHDWRDNGGSIASGSFLTAGMVVAPCTIKTLSAIAQSFNDNLLVRAADVCLKERRRLILVVRETPLHLGHLRLLCTAAELGAVILPPIPSFYHLPKTIDDIVAQTLGKVLDQLAIPHNLFRRWGTRGMTEQEAP